jgi:hypothetical protein
MPMTLRSFYPSSQEKGSKIEDGKLRLDTGEEPMAGDKLEILLSPALKPILSEAGVQLKGLNPQLSQILDLPALIPNNHRIPGIDYRDVERTFVFALKQNLCLIL